MARIRVDPLNIKFPITNPKTGTPSPAFMRLWQNLFGNDDDNADTIQDVIKDLRDNVIEAADSTIDVTGSGSLLDGPVKLAADVQAILNKLGSTQGDVLYRGATAWSVLGPGTSGYVLTTGGAGANPAWAAGAPTTPALTHNHIFVGNSSGVAADVAMSGDATIADTGAVTVLKTNGIAFGYYATGTDAANLTGTLNNARLSAVPNSALANSSVTLNTHSLSLGGTLTLSTTDIFADWSVSGHTLTQSAVGGNALYVLQGETGAQFQVTRYSTNANASQVSGRKARGTIAAPTVVAQNDIVFQQVGSGYDGVSAFQTAATVRYAIEEPTPSATAMGGSVRFLVTSLGALTSPEVTRLLAASQRFLGPVGIGQAVTGAPASGFVLDLTSTTGALGVPSMTTTQKNALNSSTPVNRMVVYDSTLGLFQFRQAGSWISLGGGGAWSITDGTHSVSGVTSLTIAGSGVVSGTSPNATLTISGTGYAPGTVPSVVQVAHATSAISATFPTAPTNGNWMVAIAFNSNSNTVGTGWTKIGENPTSTDWSDLLIKKAGASEPTTQSPMLNATANGGVVIWEISGANSTTPVGFWQSQGEQVDTQNVPVVIPNSVNCLGLSAVSVITSGAIAAAFNVGTQDVLDNTGNRRLIAGHTDFSKTPLVGIAAALSVSASTKGLTCLITS